MPQADSAHTTNVVSLATRQPVATAAPPLPLRGPPTPEAVLVAGLLMALREEQPKAKNRRWAAINHHVGRLFLIAPDDENIEAAL